jgi:uncharacterized protein YbjT (DUF2867 family)
MSDKQAVLIIGGTRGTGLLIARLLERHRFPVRVLARNPDRARMVLASNVQVLRGDITKPETLPPAIEGVGHIIFTAGRRSGLPATDAQIKATEYGARSQRRDALAFLAVSCT